jgi:hypothetical protein
MSQTRCRWLFVLVGIALVGCSKQTPATRHDPTVAVFSLDTTNLRLDRATQAVLHEQLTGALAGAELFQVVPRELLLKKLKHRRRRAERTCRSQRCQAKLGPRLFGATHAVSTRIAQNLMGQCDVLAALRDLGQGADAAKAHARAGCSEAELVRSINWAACEIIARYRARSDEGNAQPDAGCLARTDLLWLDHKLEAFSRPAKGGADERQMAERVLALRRELEGIDRHGSAPWSLAALCRTGRLYDLYAEQVATGAAAKPPLAVRRLGREAVEAYHAQQRKAREQRAAPFRAQAVELYDRCLARAKELDVSNRYTEEAGSRRRALAPR